jgi:hypothetical protein
LSQILIMAGRPAQAVEWLDKSIAGDPINKQHYLLSQGWALTVNQEPEKAIAVLKNAEISPFTFGFLAINCVRLNRTEEAAAAIKKL